MLLTVEGEEKRQESPPTIGLCEVDGVDDAEDLELKSKSQDTWALIWWVVEQTLLGGLAYRAIVGAIDMQMQEI